MLNMAGVIVFVADQVFPEPSTAKFRVCPRVART